MAKNQPFGRLHSPDSQLALTLSLSLSLVTAMKLFLFIIGSLIISRATCESLGRAQERRRLQQRETAWHSDLSKTQKPSLTATNPEDVKALKALYNATNGDYWSTNTGWLHGDPCQDLWFGLYCNNSDRVLSIMIDYGNMTGTLPAELAKADALQSLYLTSNNIGGKIPAEILSMKSLQVLELGSNKFTGLPDAISMPNLTTFRLYSNHLHGSLPTKWDAPQLQTIELDPNHLTGPLPESIGNLTNLQTLVLSGNNFTGTFPSSWGNLANVQELTLYHNNFDSPSIPSSWRGMKHLRDIELDNVKGTLPSWIGSSWSHLSNLAAVDGSLTGDLPTSLCNLKDLGGIDFANNSLTGKIPTCLCEVATLRSIQLSDNQLTGSIPDCIGHLEHLVYFNLTRNYLSGTLPDSVGDPHHLRLIDVGSNELYGAIPSSLSNLTNRVYDFVVSSNKFSTIEGGLEDFFKSTRLTCKLGNNPWSCPLPSYLPKDCGAECSKCNTGDQHDYCSSCVEDSACGWCNEGPNCLEGSSSGPDIIYTCKPQDWTYGTASQCP